MGERKRTRDRRRDLIGQLCGNFPARATENAGFDGVAMRLRAVDVVVVVVVVRQVMDDDDDDDDDGLLYMLGTEVIHSYCIEVIHSYCIISVECACDWLPSPRLGI